MERFLKSPKIFKSVWIHTNIKMCLCVVICCCMNHIDLINHTHYQLDLAENCGRMPKFYKFIVINDKIFGKSKQAALILVMQISCFCKQ